MDQQNQIGMWGKAISIGGREEQQDSVEIFASAQSTLLIVADGMGGHQGGQIASSLLTKAAGNIFQGTPQINNVEHFFNNIIQTAYRQICEHAAQTDSNPHATVVMLLLQNRQVFWAHIGDSRLIRFKRGQFHERTRDHSVVELLVHDGEIKESEMADHPDQNKLLRSIGGDTPPKASFGKANLEAGDAFLLCSDGLWETVSNQEMATHIYSKSPQEAADFLVGTAQNRGGKAGDNVSCALWKSRETFQRVAAPAQSSEKRTPTGERHEELEVNRFERPPGSPWKPIALLLFGIIIGIIIVYFGSPLKQTWQKISNNFFAPAATDSTKVGKDSSHTTDQLNMNITADSTLLDNILQTDSSSQQATQDSNIRPENLQLDAQNPETDQLQQKTQPDSGSEPSGKENLKNNE